MGWAISICNAALPHCMTLAPCSSSCACEALPDSCFGTG
jgi:hypothetical protein